ncbi:TPA: helix-turn-helix transcriptional regulator [Streptococcus agalactiae]|nr:helix-turn-helix transcriptional regulator [Streptococcus agalactiae]
MLILGEILCGKKINKIMLEKNLNMNKLAELTGINKSHFSDLKSGRIKHLSWPNMVKLSIGLGVSLDEFR